MGRLLLALLVGSRDNNKNQSPQFDNRSPPRNPFSSSWPSCCAEVSCGAHKRSYGLPGEKRRDKIRFSDHHTIHRAPVCCIVWHTFDMSEDAFSASNYDTWLTSGSAKNGCLLWDTDFRSFLLKVALVAGDWQRCPSSIKQQIWVTSGDPFKLIFGALFDSWFLFNRTLCDFSCRRSLKNRSLRFQHRLPGLETSFVLCFVQTNISRMQGSDAILDHVIGRAPVRVTSNLTRPSAQPCPSALSKVSSSWRWLLPLSWPVCWL